MPEEHDASPTWSGFSHQGKVAIFLVLQEIIRLKGFGVSDFSEYWLELEWVEDISLGRGDDNYISIHQIKNKPNSRTESTYSNAIAKLEGQLKCSTKYLHVTCCPSFSISNPGVAFFEYEPSKKYCEMDSIKTYICSLLKGYTGTGDVEIEYCLLLDLVDEHIKKRHQELHNNRDASVRRVSFEVFIRKMQEKDTFVGIFLKYKIKEKFIQLFENFLEGLDPFEEEVMKNSIEPIISVDPNVFFEFIRKINPEKIILSHDVLSYLDLTDTARIQDVFLETIKQCKKCGHSLDQIPVVHGNESILISSINRDQRHADSVCNQIYENAKRCPDMRKLLFEVEVISNKEISSQIQGNWGELATEELSRISSLIDPLTKRLDRFSNLFPQG